MKVLVNALSARKGGIVTYTRNLLKAFKARGLDATIAVPEEFDPSIEDGTLRMNISGYGPVRRFFWEQFSWRRQVAQFRPDVLFSSANFGLLKSPVPQVLLLREGGLFDPDYLADIAPAQGALAVINRSVRRKLMLVSAQRATMIMTPTHAMRDMVAKWRPGLDSKCTINPYGTLMDKFVPTQQPRSWREDGTLRILYVSVYYPHKVPHVVCRAVELLNAAGVSAHATITMSLEELETMNGGAVDQKVIAAASEAGSVDLGNVGYDDLPSLYGNHDVFVFPSVSETFGHPMAEAMSMGMPLVVADTPVNREICGDSAVYFTPGRVSEVVEGIMALDGDPERRTRASRIGRERVERNFAWDDHVDRLIESFEEAVSQPLRRVG